MTFADLGLSAPILEAVASEGYEIPSPIQAETIPHAIAGRDVLGCAQTGTGKTAAFALPILHLLSAAHNAPRKNKRLPRALVLAPTRELAQQIAESCQTYGQHVDVYGTVIYGGVGQGTQVNALRKGVDVVVATPGRLLDLINQGFCDLSSIQVLVLDEADRMLDMGFMPDIKRIISHTPQKKQTLLFSATMPNEIKKFADALLTNPARVTIQPDAPAAERIEQRVYHVAKPDKPELLVHLMQTLPISRAIVFSRTKHGADRIAKTLKRAGTTAEAIHGDKTQGARKKALDRFKENKVQVLVATDIAARGIDVDNISHVFNYDLSRDAENHVHRIGRTARAGAEGVAISFCDREEIPHLKAIERLIRMKIEVFGDAPAEAREKPQRVRRADHPLDAVKADARDSRSGGGSKPHHRRRQRTAKSQDTQTAHTFTDDRDGSGDGFTRKKRRPRNKKRRANADAFAGGAPSNAPPKGKKKQGGGSPNPQGKSKTAKAKRSGGPNAGKQGANPQNRGTGVVRRKKSK